MTMAWPQRHDDNGIITDAWIRLSDESTMATMAWHYWSDDDGKIAWWKWHDDGGITKESRMTKLEWRQWNNHADIATAWWRRHDENQSTNLEWRRATTVMVSRQRASTVCQAIRDLGSCWRRDDVGMTRVEWWSWSDDDRMTTMTWHWRYDNECMTTVRQRWHDDNGMMGVAWQSWNDDDDTTTSMASWPQAHT